MRNSNASSSRLQLLLTDRSPVSQDAPASLPGQLGTEFSWNYNHVSSLWKNDGWIDDAAAASARAHYGAFSIKNHFGLRVISINTDFWYRPNLFAFINTTNPDVSGTFKFLVEELQAAEDAHERVWILGHVLSGFDGINLLPNPSNLFYQIIERYSPHVIVGAFWGHTHEDQNMIYYTSQSGVVSRRARSINHVKPESLDSVPGIYHRDSPFGFAHC